MSTRDPRGYLLWLVWARLRGETGWVCPIACLDEDDARTFAQTAVQKQRGKWEFTVRHLTEGPPA